jgi:hypothetical protein
MTKRAIKIRNEKSGLEVRVLVGGGHLGDGVIDFGPISDAVAAAGYRGYVGRRSSTRTCGPRRRITRLALRS